MIEVFRPPARSKSDRGEVCGLGSMVQMRAFRPQIRVY